MEVVMGETDYYKFLLKLEDGPHAAIPINVRGDFSRFTAPNGMFSTSINGLCSSLQIPSSSCITDKLIGSGGNGKVEISRRGHWPITARHDTSHPLQRD
jgi:hypothetical protein